VGSRNLWLLKKATDDWWKVIDKYPQIVDLLRDVPGCVLYGEVYGDVQDLRYGMSNGEVDFAAFDLRSESGPFYHYENFLYAMFAYKIPVVPLLTTAPIPYDPDQILEMAEGKTLIEGANHIREGVVVRPLMERLDPTVGRVVLKVVSTAYLETQK
jgi:RNA ligase (TIGR02306 family)